MVTIRKISIFLLCLVVITSLSFSVFASSGTFTTPSGSSYNYTNSSGSSTGTSNYWTAHLNTLNSIAYWLKGMNGTSFWYYDGDTSSNNTDFFRAITYSLYYIGRELKLMNTSSTTNYWTSSNVASVVTDVDSIQSQTSTINTNVSAIKTSTTSIATDVDHIDDDFHTFLSRLGTPTSGSSFWSELVNIYTKISHIDSDFHILNGFVEDLHEIFASPEDLALKHDQENNVASATSNFLSGSSSSTSIGVGDIGSMKSIGDDFASNFDTGVSGTSLFGLIFDNSNDGPFSWFTQDTLDNLSPSNSRGNVRSGTKSGEDVVDFYADKMADLNKLLSEVAKDD